MHTSEKLNHDAYQYVIGNLIALKGREIGIYEVNEDGSVVPISSPKNSDVCDVLGHVLWFLRAAARGFGERENRVDNPATPGTVSLECTRTDVNAKAPESSEDKTLGQIGSWFLG